MFNIQSLIQTVTQMSSNPQAVLQRYGIPRDLKTPEEVAQYLMNNGRVSQDQVNQASNMYRQLFRR